MEPEPAAQTPCPSPEEMEVVAGVPASRPLAKISKARPVAITAAAGVGAGVRLETLRMVQRAVQVEFLPAEEEAEARARSLPQTAIVETAPTAGWAEFSGEEEVVGLAAVEPTPVRDRVPWGALEAGGEEPVVPLAPEERQGSVETLVSVAEQEEIRTPEVWVAPHLVARFLSDRGAVCGS